MTSFVTLSAALPQAPKIIAVSADSELVHDRLSCADIPRTGLGNPKEKPAGPKNER